MSQYTAFTVAVTYNSNTVVGAEGTKFLSNVQVGNSFKVKGDMVIYTVASIVDDTHLVLSGAYQGVTNYTAQYQVSRDFTPHLGLAEVNPGDQDWPTHLTQETIRKLDTAVAMAATGQIFKGTWDATNNLPPIPLPSTGNANWVYRVTVAGSYNPNTADGTPAISWLAGDSVACNGTAWFRLPTLDASAAASAAAAEADRIATASDRVLTGLDRVATAADRVQTGLDKTATASDRLQTGSDRTSTGAFRDQAAASASAAAADKATVETIATALRDVAGNVNTNLTTIQVQNSVINNYGQTTLADLQLPAAAAGMNFMLVCSVASSYSWRVRAGASDKIYLDGVAGVDNGYVGIAAPTVGSYISFFTFKTGAATWDWIAVSGTGIWGVI